MLPKHLVKKGFFLQTLISMLVFFFFLLLLFFWLLPAFTFCPFFLASFRVFSVSVVLTAAVTQASLQSMLHKILTAGPSAFNITTLLSQATQLSSQGIYTLYLSRTTFYFQPCCFFIHATMPSKYCLDVCGFKVGSVLWPDLELHNLSSWIWFVFGARLCCRFMSAVGFWVSFLELADGLGSLAHTHTHTHTNTQTWLLLSEQIMVGHVGLKNDFWFEHK